MKTQIINLASHDDLISVRDRMTWAKAPRILLVWPASEQVALRPLDLRILQQHGRTLGAKVGLVTRRGSVRRDAQSFGIPVFRTTAAAQREPWSGRVARRWGRTDRNRTRARELRRMRERLDIGVLPWTSRPAVRIGVFALGVLAVFSVASLFVPTATISLKPISMEQTMSLALEVSPTIDSGIMSGVIPAQSASVEVVGSQSLQVRSEMDVPKEKATGTARFQNLTTSGIVIPAGSIVYSLAPTAVRFATLQEAELEGRSNATVEVPIAAVQAGKEGNVTANSIQGIEGALSASTAVLNPEPTRGGSDASEHVPSQADRDQLRAAVVSELQTEAEARIKSTVAEVDLIVPDTLRLVSVEEETFDPAAGQASSILSLRMRAIYEATYVRGADVRRLAQLALDSQVPADYIPRQGTLRLQLSVGSGAGEGGRAQLNLGAARTIMRKIDSSTVNGIARGRTLQQAVSQLQTALPLAAPPEIRMTPSWWPWLPLIPFRLDVVVS